MIAKRRSVRKFKENPVPDEQINKILEAGRWAPSAGNTQPWHFIVVTKPEVKQRIAGACTESSKKAWSQFPTERAKYLAQRGGSWDKSAMVNIPTLIAVCYEIPEWMREELALGSAWTAIQNMLLTATSESLGSCVYTFYDVGEEEKLKEILQVPTRYRIAAIIQLGYSRIDPPSPSRKGLEEIVSHQHF